MRILDGKQRTWNAYLAGIGASGALMASAFVLFVILVGVVTFKTWPTAGGLLPGGGGEVALQGDAKPAPQRTAARPSGPDLVALLGGRGSAGVPPAGAPDTGPGPKRNGPLPRGG